MEQENKVAKKKTKKNSNLKNTGLSAPIKLKILVTIVERSKTSFYLDVLEGFEVNLQTVIYGHGTASSEMMHYFGMNDSSKAVIFSMVREDRIREIEAAFEDKYFKTKNGKGIAFVIPISSMIGVMIYQFLTNSKEMGKSE